MTPILAHAVIPQGLMDAFSGKDGGVEGRLFRVAEEWIMERFNPSV